MGKSYDGDPLGRSFTTASQREQEQLDAAARRRVRDAKSAIRAARGDERPDGNELRALGRMVGVDRGALVTTARTPAQRSFDDAGDDSTAARRARRISEEVDEQDEDLAEDEQEKRPARAKLTSVERALVKQMGVSPSKFAKHRNAKKAQELEEDEDLAGDGDGSLRHGKPASSPLGPTDNAGEPGPGATRMPTNPDNPVVRRPAARLSRTADLGSYWSPSAIRDRAIAQFAQECVRLGVDPPRSMLGVPEHPSEIVVETAEDLVSLELSPIELALARELGVKPEQLLARKAKGVVFDPVED